MLADKSSPDKAGAGIVSVRADDDQPSPHLKPFSALRPAGRKPRPLFLSSLGSAGAWGRALWLGLLVWAGAAVAMGQSFQGALRGSVRDGSGGAMSAVTLTLINEATNLARITETNEAGEYVFEKVEPGKYKI